MASIEYKFSPDNIWFTADTHFGHENIIRFCNRPFRNEEEMNAELIRRWRETVPEDGIVFHLGDFAHGNARLWNDILSALPGRKYLILGNHDMKALRQGYMGRFELVTQQMSIRVGGQAIILNHNPFLCYGGSYRDVWQLFGHVHSGPWSNTGLDHPRLQYLFPRQYDVGVDNNEFRPVSFYELKEKIDAQVRRAQDSVGVPSFGDFELRTIVFLDPAVAPSNKAQKEAFARIAQETGAKTIELQPKNGETVKEAIARKISAIGGSTRYVYIGRQPLKDFRLVKVGDGEGITKEIANKAILLLR